MIVTLLLEVMKQLSRTNNTAAIDNTVNGFNIFTCSSNMSDITFFVCIPNLGSGILAQICKSYDERVTDIKTNPGFIVNIDREKDVQGRLIYKDYMVPLDGIDASMFITSFSVKQTCSGGSQLSSNLSTFVPVRIIPKSPYKEYIETEQNNIKTNNKLQENTAYDIYINNFNITRSLINTTNSKLEKAILTMVMRYFTVTNNLIDYELDENNEVISITNPETRWAFPKKLEHKQYSATNKTRYEYPDIFFPFVKSDQYYSDVAGGISDVDIVNIFAKPFVLIRPEYGDRRLYYSKDVSKFILSNLKITGCDSPPQIEHNGRIKIYGSPITGYLCESYTINDLIELNITEDEYKALSGSGGDLYTYMNYIDNITSIKRKTAENSSELTVVSTNLITQIPPIFSNGEVFLDNDFELVIPFGMEYILPVTDNGYITSSEFLNLEYNQTKDVASEGFYHLIYGTYTFGNELRSYITRLRSNAPSPFPSNDNDVKKMQQLGSYRLYQSGFQVANGFLMKGCRIYPYITASSNDIINTYSIELPSYPVYEAIPEKPNIKNYSDTDAYNIALAEYNRILNSENQRVKITTSVLMRIDKIKYINASYTFAQNLLHPIIYDYVPGFIRKPQQSAPVTCGIDHGFSIGDQTNTTSVNKPATVSIDETGYISKNELFKSSTLNLELCNIPELLDAISDLTYSIENFIDDTILKVVSKETVTIDTQEYTLVTELNQPCSVINAIGDGFIDGSKFHIDPTNIIGYYGHTYTEILNQLSDIFNINKNSKLYNLKQLTSTNDSISRNILRIQSLVPIVNRETIQPSIEKCKELFAMFYKQTEDFHQLYVLDSDEHVLLNIHNDIIGYGLWFYNTRKVYLLYCSFISLLQSMIDELYSKLMSMLKGYAPMILDNAMVAKSPLHFFCFYNNNKPVYPILSNDIDIATCGDIYLNKIQRLFDENVYYYDVTINLAGIPQNSEAVTVLMTGNGYYKNTYDSVPTSNIKPWENPTVFSQLSESDKSILVADFQELGDISSTDHIYASGDNCIQFKDTGTSLEQKSFTKDMVVKEINNHKIQLRHIPEILLRGKIDAGYIFPFVTTGSFISEFPADFTALYKTNYPIDIQSIDDSLSFNTLSVPTSSVNFKTTDEYKEAILGADIVADKIFTSLTNSNMLSTIVANSDSTITVTIVNNSLMYHRSGFTGAVFQKALFTDTLGDIDSEIIGDNYWKTFDAVNTKQNTPQARNYNLYLSKRRGVFTSYLILCKLVEKLISCGATFNTETNTLEYRPAKTSKVVKLSISSQTPSTTGKAFKLFNVYGFGGLFMKIDSTKKGRFTESLLSITKLSFTENDAKRLTHKTETDDIELDITFGSNPSIVIPEHSFYFPAIDNISTNEKHKYIYGEMLKHLKNNYVGIVGANSNINNIFNTTNSKRAADMVKTYVEQNMDKFKVSCNITNVWVIIEDEN